ncbi:hypothetical protein RRG08_025103 [Elysia crispata]|uniref:Uncharacterized protein n=1 Tax=Elysia crispata TaxID=231223 RepID=A0AAE1AIQ1_9GAST|nr:hypothetical protein RRG08_025103 [Elysia crispata]
MVRARGVGAENSGGEIPEVVFVCCLQHSGNTTGANLSSGNRRCIEVCIRDLKTLDINIESWPDPTS